MSKRLFQYNIHNHKTLFDQTPIENNLTTLLNGETALCILTMKHMTALVTDKYSIHGIAKYIGGTFTEVDAHRALKILKKRTNKFSNICEFTVLFDY